MRKEGTLRFPLQLGWCFCVFDYYSIAIYTVKLQLCMRHDKVCDDRQSIISFKIIFNFIYTLQVVLLGMVLGRRLQSIVITYR